MSDADSVAAKKRAAAERIDGGDPAAAGHLLSQCARLAPDDAEVPYLMGMAALRQGDLNEATARLGDALRMAPGYQQALRQLAGVLAQAGRFAEAAQHYRSLVAAAPTAFAYFSLANVLARQFDFDEAVDHYRRALALEPGRAEIYNNLGNAYHLQGKYAEAEEAYREALRLKPDHPAAYEAYANIATTQLLMRRIEDARANYARALELKPGFRRALAGTASVMELLGDSQGAYTILQPLLETADVDASTAWVFSNLCRPLGRCDEAVALMERLLDGQGAPLDNHDRILLHFASGKLLDAAEKYPRAFEHYRQGNALARRSFDVRAHQRYIDSLMAVYSKEFAARAPRSANGARPVFIVGMPRSGTTLVEQILASHPAVFGAGELYEMDRVAAAVHTVVGSDEHYPRCTAGLTASQCEQLAGRYLNAVAKLAPPGTLRITDKMPANFLHLGLINQLFPEACVIHCIRDPLDTCLSCYFQQFGGQDFSFDLAHTGAYYGQYERLMNHWHDALDLHILDVRYEDLVENTGRVTRELVEFCRLEWDERCTRFYETRRVVHTASYDQVRQPVYNRSVGRWRHYAEYLGPLQEALARD